MSYKNACLVSDIPANLEVVGQTDYTFKSCDVADLAVKLQTFLDNPDKIAASREAMSTKVVQEYNWETIVNKIVKLYQEAITVKKSK